MPLVTKLRVETRGKLHYFWQLGNTKLGSKLKHARNVKTRTERLWRAFILEFDFRKYDELLLFTSVPTWWGCGGHVGKCEKTVEGAHLVIYIMVTIGNLIMYMMVIDHLTMGNRPNHTSDHIIGGSVTIWWLLIIFSTVPAWLDTAFKSSCRCL